MAESASQTIHFVTNNPSKFDEYTSIFSALNVSVLLYRTDIVEIQHRDLDFIAKSKALTAFSRFGRALFVEHTALCIKSLGGLPSGLTRIFLESIGERTLCELFGRPKFNEASGRTVIAYCDTKRIICFTGSLDGKISTSPRGGDQPWETFGWNRVFVPAGYDKTLSELGPTIKNQISMRRKAAERFAAHLRSAPC